MPSYSNIPESLEKWLIKLEQIQKLLKENLKNLDFLMPTQDLPEDFMLFWKEIILKSKAIISSLIKLCDSSKYIFSTNTENDIHKFFIFVKDSKKISNLEKETLPDLTV